MSAARPRVLIAEDEDLARDRLARMVQARADFELVAVCRNGDQAQAALDAGGVDIALLDIQMPGKDGMAVLGDLDDPSGPLVIFTTAHPRYAVDAFAGRAIDYLLKPFDRARLDQALDGARERLQARAAMALTEHIRSAIGAIDARSASAATVRGHIAVREDGRVRLLRHNQIEWVAAAGRHCVLHCAASERHVVEGPLTSLATELREAGFVQVSRSALINIEQIRELQDMFKGNLVAVMRNGAKIAVSRRFRGRVLGQLGA